MVIRRYNLLPLKKYKVSECSFIFTLILLFKYSCLIALEAYNKKKMTKNAINHWINVKHIFSLCLFSFKTVE